MTDDPNVPPSQPPASEPPSDQPPGYQPPAYQPPTPPAGPAGPAEVTRIAAEIAALATTSAGLKRSGTEEIGASRDALVARIAEIRTMIAGLSDDTAKAGFYHQLVEPMPDYKTLLTGGGRERLRILRERYGEGADGRLRDGRLGPTSCSRRRPR